MPASEIKSRKENRLTDDIPTEDKADIDHIDIDHIDMRKVSQSVYGPPGKTGQNTISATNSPPSQGAFSGVFSHRSLSALEFGNDLTNSGLLYGNTNVEPSVGTDSRVGSGSDKATKRTRQFTPASAKAIDDEDEPRRSSPRQHAGMGEQVAPNN